MGDSEGETHLHDNERLHDSKSHIQPCKETQLTEVVVAADEFVVPVPHYHCQSLHNVPYEPYHDWLQSCHNVQTQNLSSA